MIDLSDGLVGDAGHVAAASGVRCVIESERVPTHPATGSPRDALVSGEEYELLVALPSSFAAENASEFLEHFDVPLTRIGELGEGEGVVVMEAGSSVDVTNGFRQFDDK
jgi:thiamine-monophosphate kinase